VLEKVKKKIFMSLGIAGLIYLAFTIYADYKQVIFAFSKFSLWLIPVILSLSFLNYISRFFKWDYYLHLLKIKITKVDSFAIFMSGLIMSVTPGKMGELLKAYLVKQVVNEPVSKTAPIIFAERITDFVSLVMIGLIGAYVFDYGRIIVAAVGVFFLLVIFIVSQKSLAIKIINFFEKFSFLKKHIEKIHTAYESSYILLQFKPIVLMSLLSLVSWFLECLGYYLVLTNFAVEVSILWSAFSYAFATIVGAISMLPGGLGVTEGSLTIMLIQKSVSKDIAVASTFIIRVATLWFAVLVGVIAVSLYQKRFGKISIDSISNTEVV